MQDLIEQLALNPDHVMPWGPGMAKVSLDALQSDRPKGKLVLVTAISPTPAGEGKTTTSIGLGQALTHLGENAAVALREPSLGPCFGVKGGGTGGGQSQLTPSTRINLHFTGDLHAVTAAHNLLAAMVDNHVHFGLQPRLQARRVRLKRVLDVNDRTLRSVITGLGGPSEGVPREAGFDITAASEVMAVLGMASGVDDLRERLGRIVVAGGKGGPYTASDVGAVGSMVALLNDAVLPNLVRTTQGTPAFVHTGPFANIAHGCSSVLGTRMALAHADWVITEAGFGCDLGGEKFLHLKAIPRGMEVAGTVLVATCRALRHHGGASDFSVPDADALRAGLPNLFKHAETLQAFGLDPIVSLNLRAGDPEDEIDIVRKACAERGIKFGVSDPYGTGGPGCTEVAELLREHANPVVPTPLYQADAPFEDKVEAVAKTVYGADGVVWTDAAKKRLGQLRRAGFGALPPCMAKTQSSLSDDPKKVNRPTGFSITVRDVEVSAGAGFIVALTGNMMRMPGLPRRPQAYDVDVVDGDIVNVG